MQFPVNVLQETGGGVAMTVNRADLMTLIEMETVVGQGTPTRLRHLRLNRPERTVVLRCKLRDRMGAEDNKTTHVVSRTHSHHPARSGAYARGKERLNARAL
jgi:hypothetical protein